MTRSQPSSPPPEMAVIVPTHQRRDLLRRVLAALARQDLERHRFQVIVVCDGCTDGSADAAREAAAPQGEAAGLALAVLEQPNSGAATARNAGVQAAAADLLLFLDDDMIAAPDLLRAHHRRHRQRPGAVIVGHLPVHPDSPRSFLTVGLARWVERRHAAMSRPGAEVPTDEVLTGQMSMSRDTFGRLGGFDTRFTAGGTFGGEDVELGWRARRRGIPVVYEPAAVSHQVYRKSFRGLCRNIRDAGAADVLMAAVHPEVRPHLPLGQVDALPRLQRLALRATGRFPRLSRIAFAPVLAALALADAAGRTAEFWEHVHGVARCHRNGLGMVDGSAAVAGGLASASRRTA